MTAKENIGTLRLLAVLNTLPDKRDEQVELLNVLCAAVRAEALSGAASVGAMAVANRAVEDAPDDAILTVRDVVRVAVVAASPVLHAEAVADERQRIASQISELPLLLNGTTIPKAPEQVRADAAQLAAGSVPVATPRLTDVIAAALCAQEEVDVYGLFEALGVVAGSVPVATPEPHVHDSDTAYDGVCANCQDYCGCCGQESDGPWCGACREHVLTDRPLWDCTYQAQHGRPCPHQVGPVATPTKPGTCPQCRHAAHGPVCFNMASDNECACSVATPTEPARQHDAECSQPKALCLVRRCPCWCHCASASPAPAVQPDDLGSLQRQAIAARARGDFAAERAALDRIIVLERSLVSPEQPEER